MTPNTISYIKKAIRFAIPYIVMRRFFTIPKSLVLSSSLLVSVSLRVTQSEIRWQQLRPGLEDIVPTNVVSN